MQTRSLQLRGNLSEVGFESSPCRVGAAKCRGRGHAQEIPGSRQRREYSQSGAGRSKKDDQCSNAGGRKVEGGSVTIIAVTSESGKGTRRPQHYDDVESPTMASTEARGDSVTGKVGNRKIC